MFYILIYVVDFGKEVFLIFAKSTEKIFNLQSSSCANISLQWERSHERQFQNSKSDQIQIKSFWPLFWIRYKKLMSLGIKI